MSVQALTEYMASMMSVKGGTTSNYGKHLQTASTVCQLVSVFIILILLQSNNIHGEADKLLERQSFSYLCFRVFR